MPEPQTTAAAMIGGSVATLTGTILGMHADALVIGCGCSLAALLHLPPMPRLRALGTVAANTLIAGVFAPSLALAATAQAAWLAALGEAPLRSTAAGAIGLLGQVAIPVLFRFIQRKGESA